MASEEVAQATRAMLRAPLSVAMTSSERLLVRKAAFVGAESVSSFIRRAATKAAARVIAREERKAA